MSSFNMPALGGQDQNMKKVYSYIQMLNERKRTIASTCSYASFSAIIVSHDTESKKLST